MFSFQQWRSDMSLWSGIGGGGFIVPHKLAYRLKEQLTVKTVLLPSYNKDANEATPTS